MICRGAKFFDFEGREGSRTRWPGHDPFSAGRSCLPRELFPMKSVWPLQEAKNKLGELIDRAASEGAQTIARHGRPVAVLLSAESYSRLHPEETLADILLDCPVKDWEVKRNDEVARDLFLE